MVAKSYLLVVSEPNDAVESVMLSQEEMLSQEVMAQSGRNAQ